MNDSYKDKKIIWTSKRKQVFLVLINLLFVIAAIWSKEKSTSISFYGAIIFFGGVSIFLLVQLIHPKYQFISPNSKLAKKILEETYKEQLESEGFFTYMENGFTLKAYEKETTVLWQDIECIFGYKEDEYTSDSICMDIFTTEKTYLNLSENILGWHQFQKRILAQIPAIPKDWQDEIAAPAFDTNFTLLYDLKSRSVEEARSEFYR